MNWKFFKLSFVFIFLSLFAHPLFSRDLASLKSCALRLVAVVGVSSARVEKDFSDESTQICLANVPAEYIEHPQFMEYAMDPDQGFRISKQSIRESMGAIALMRQGRVSGQVERVEKSLYADFRDGDGNGFDIKAYSSPRDSHAKPYDPQTLVAAVLEKMQRPYVNPRSGQMATIRVFVDLTWLTQEDRQRSFEALAKALTPEQLAEVEYFELPEPQIKFRRPDWAE